MSDVKWSVFEDTYSPATGVVNELPSGMYDAGVTWGRVYFKRIPVKTDKLYLLPRTATDQVMKDISTFWVKKTEFARFGVMYKRGVLLYGPPGTGKTSVINLVAQEAAKRNAVSLRLKSRIEGFKEAMKTLRGAQPERPIIVMIEDMDRWVMNGDEEELLDMLDGADQIDNVVYVATTNYLDRLPARLVNRPSRFDRKIEIGPPDAETRALFFENMSGEKSPEWSKWAEKSDGLTFAHLKEMFISVKILGNSFKDTVDTLRKMAEEAPEDDSDTDPDND